MPKIIIEMNVLLLGVLLNVLMIGFFLFVEIVFIAFEKATVLKFRFSIFFVNKIQSFSLAMMVIVPVINISYHHNHINPILEYKMSILIILVFTIFFKGPKIKGFLMKLWKLTNEESVVIVSPDKVNPYNDEFLMSLAFQKKHILTALNGALKLEHDHTSGRRELTDSYLSKIRFKTRFLKNELEEFDVYIDFCCSQSNKWEIANAPIPMDQIEFSFGGWL